VKEPIIVELEEVCFPFRREKLLDSTMPNVNAPVYRDRLGNSRPDDIGFAVGRGTNEVFVLRQESSSSCFSRIRISRS
jgi:hypothetical protein